MTAEPSSGLARDALRVGLASSIVFAALLFANVASAGPSSSEQRQAKALFEQGVALSDDGKWAEALAVFKKSDALVPSLNVRFNIAATERALGHYVEAKKLLEAILADPELKSKSKAALRPQVEKLLGEVKPKLVSLTVHVVPENADLEIDGAKVELDLRGRALLNPGKHVFTVSAEGYDTTTVNRSLEPGDASIDLVAPAVQVAIVEKEVVVDKPRPFYAKGWFLAGAGVVVAGATAAIVVGVVRSKSSGPAVSPPGSSTGLVFPAGFAVRF